MKRRRRTVLRVFGMSLLFSGVALVTHIVSGVSLRLALALGGFVPALAFVLVWRRMELNARRRLVRQLEVGLVAGVIATGAYDLTRFGLSGWDSSAYNPFEAIRIFG